MRNFNQHTTKLIRRKQENIFGKKSIPSPFFQPKLTINQPGDMYEQEADAMADKVMRMRDNDVADKPFFNPAISSVQRKCAHCEGEDKKMQRKESGTESTSTDTATTYINSLSGGRSLTGKERSFYEPRIGYDFSEVRLHTDSAADLSAKSINALAYTHSNHIVFASNQYQPETDSGKKLMAHELTHTVQQNSTASRAAGLVQRRLTVNPTDVVPLAPGSLGPALPLTIAVQGMLNDTCADGNFVVDQTTGNVTATDAKFCEPWHIPMLPEIRRVNRTATPAGCACLCDVVNNANTTTVSFSAGGPGTTPGSVPGAGAGQGGARTNSGVHIDPRFQGQYRINGQWVDVPFFLLFAHELCGHALPKMLGTHAARGATPAGGTPPQERRAVDVERDIAAEHQLPRRPEDYAGAARQRP